MKQSVFVSGLIISAFVVSAIIYFYALPQFIRDGGPLVIALIALSIMVFTFTVERTLSLHKANGKGPLPKFLKAVERSLEEQKLEDAVALCDQQQGSLAVILKAGLTRYRELQKRKKPLSPDRLIAELQKAFEEATSLEMPLLEKNLIAIATIASVATMVGLLGTTLGMIRAFQALATTGSPDAVQLSLGISEALVNTAGGLVSAIAGIVAYNVFINKVDTFTYQLDEAVYNIVQTVKVQAGEEEEEA
ncbi:MAG: MotA/TolQ/ExbB proton channel family protein [Bacteroidetes bacterium]|jgi:biopolymer transport protein ExbB|nr:MotA/TolQ/ExbB proton channel family protein [Bacteroidota bacterium]